jgi:multidrug efflux system membrane fusion protein
MRHPVVAFLIAVAAGQGCAKHDSGTPISVPVTVATAVKQPVPYLITASGSVEPLQRVNIEAQVTGQLMRIGFHEGDQVQQGQVLFEIDPRSYRAALDQAEAVLARDIVQVQNADRDVERYAVLVKQDYVTSQQFDAARANAAALRAAVMADSASVESARLSLQYATIRAPISGLAGSLQIRGGNLVRGPGTTLVTINQTHPILVRFAVPAQNLAQIRSRPMNAVTLTATPAGGGKPETGRLNFLDNAVDTTTGTILLKGIFDNADGGLWPGQFVNVSAQLFVQQDALVIPANAVISGQQGNSVFLIDSADTATPRAISVERTAGDLVVLSGGLKPGDRVVTDGQLRLTPGAKVEIKEAPVQAPSDSS